MYNLHIQDGANIFDDKYFYNVKCLGRIVNQSGRLQATKYFFVSHSKYFIAEESVNMTNFDCTVELYEVDSLLDQADEYLGSSISNLVIENITDSLVNNIETETLKENMIDTIHKDDVYIFRNSTGSAFGGIMSTRRFVRTSLSDFRDKIKEYENL